MSDEVIVRDCGETLKADGKQCMNCKHVKDVKGYMGMECGELGHFVEYDNACDKHEAR